MWLQLFDKVIASTLGTVLIVDQICPDSNFKYKIWCFEHKKWGSVYLVPSYWRKGDISKNLAAHTRTRWTKWTVWMIHQHINMSKWPHSNLLKYCRQGKNSTIALKHDHITVSFAVIHQGSHFSAFLILFLFPCCISVSLSLSISAALFSNLPIRLLLLPFLLLPLLYCSDSNRLINISCPLLSKKTHPFSLLWLLSFFLYWHFFPTSSHFHHFEYSLFGYFLLEHQFFPQ